MRYLVILNRFEVWLLFAVVGFVIVYGLRPPESTEVPPESVPEKEAAVITGDDPVAPTQEPTEEEIEKFFRVDEVAVIPSGDGRIVELMVAARSRSGETVLLGDSEIRAETETGNPIPPFFEPFRKEQSVYPDEPSLVVVKLWLEEETDAIWLEFEGERTRATLSQ